jgi:hypothetical protein
MARFEFEFKTFLVVLPFIFDHVENYVCLSHGVYVTCATWWATMRIVVRVEDLVQRTGDGQAQVRYSVVGRSGGRVTPFAVCTVHEETMSVGFLVEPQNQGQRFPGLGLKTSSFGLIIWVSKLPQRFPVLGLKTKWMMVHRFCHKINRRRTVRDTHQDLAACFSVR